MLFEGEGTPGKPERETGKFHIPIGSVLVGPVGAEGHLNIAKREGFKQEPIGPGVEGLDFIPFHCQAAGHDDEALAVI